MVRAVVARVGNRQASPKVQLLRCCIPEAAGTPSSFDRLANAFVDNRDYPRADRTSSSREVVCCQLCEIISRPTGRGAETQL